MTKQLNVYGKQKHTAHIDFDIIVNQAARYGADHAIPYPEVFEHIDLLIQEWLEPIGGLVCTEEYKLYRSCPRDQNYRRLFLPTYKANRDKAKPTEEEERRAEMIRLSWEYAHDTYQIESHPYAEADDLLATGLSGKGTGLWNICITIDKDLRTRSGWHFNPRKDQGPVWVSSTEAWYNLMYQWLVGDATDNIPGCPRIGPVKAKRLLDRGVAEERCLGSVCMEAYTNAGCSRWYALSQWIAVYINPDIKEGLIELPPGFYPPDSEECFLKIPL